MSELEPSQQWRTMNALLKHVWGDSPAQDRVWAQVTGMAPRKAVASPLMVLQAFIDDSATDGGVFVLAGYIATAEAWAKFAADWEEIISYGVLDKNDEYHFKMMEMAKSEERKSRVGAFYRVIEGHNLIALSLKFDVRDYKKAKGRIWALGSTIDFSAFDNPYIFAFKCLMDGFHAGRANFSELIGQNEVVEFYFDDQSEKNIILSFWNDYMNSRDAETRKLYGSTPRFEDDKKFLPLQAADLWAWWIRYWNEQEPASESRKFELPGWTGGNVDIRGLEMSLDENQIVEALLTVIKASSPGIAVYDSNYFREYR